MSNYQFINLSYLEEMSGGDHATKKTLLNMLYKELDQSVPKLRQLYQKGKWDELGKTCHHMKSTLSFAGNDAMIRANQQLWEMVTRKNYQPNQAEAAINFIEAHSRQSKREIKLALKELG